jgi:hypothetical protein
VRALDAVTQSNRLDTTILVAGPGVHCHRIGIVEKNCSRFGNLTDFFAQVEQFDDGALGIHNPASADGVTNTLVDTVFEWDIYIRLESFQPALANGGNDIIGVCDGRAAIHGRFYPGRQLAGPHIAFGQLIDHVQVSLGNVHQREMRVGQFRDGQDVIHQAASKAHGTRANHGNFYWHVFAPWKNHLWYILENWQQTVGHVEHVTYMQSI